MSRILTVKFPEALLSRLEETADEAGASKGEIIRRAVESLLGKEDDKGRIQRITRALQTGSRPGRACDWKELYRSTRVPSPLSPEEEVLRSRFRRR